MSEPLAGEGTRPAVILLHGALGTARSLDAIAERLAPQFDVHRFDLAGHGSAPPPTDSTFGMETFASQVAAHVEAHGLAPARLFGFSMGGYAALHLAATRPELVAKVVTLGTVLAWTPEVAAREGRQLDPAKIREKVPRFAAMLEERHGARWEALCADTKGMLESLGERPLLGPEAFGRIECPVRLMVGDRDATVSLEETVAAYRALKAGELEVLPGTAHAIEKVDAGRVAGALAGFFTT